jgi:hypothetical protein
MNHQEVSGMRSRRVKRHVWWFAMAATVFAILLPLDASGQDLPEEEETQEESEEESQEEDQEEDPFRDFERLLEDAEVFPGFFDLYTKEGRLYLAVPQDRLGKEFLMDARVARGIGAAGLFGGTTLSFFEMDLMAFEKHGENVYLVQRPHQFGAGSDERVLDAVDISFDPAPN